MSSNMAIPAANIGGNIVSPTPDGKIKVTTAKGKERVLTQDQFIKQIKKNEENIKAGKDFEIKKDNKTAKIVGLVAAAAAIVTGVVYRKEIGKWFSKTADKVKDMVKGSKKADKRYANISSEEVRKCRAERTLKEFGNDVIETNQKARTAELQTMKEDAIAAFKNYDDKAALKAAKSSRTEALKAHGVTEAEYKAIKAYADPNAAVTAELPVWARDKETCQRYINAIEASTSKNLKAKLAEQTTTAAEKSAPKKTGKKGKANAEKTNAAPKNKSDKKADQPKAETKTEDKK